MLDKDILLFLESEKSDDSTTKKTARDEDEFKRTNVSMPTKKQKTETKSKFNKNKMTNRRSYLLLMA